MAPLTLDPHETTTQITGSEYDRFEVVACYAPQFQQMVSHELDRLAGLEPNWDAEGAPPIDPAIIQAARRLIERLPENSASMPAVVPSAAGNLQFEWNAGRRSLELEIETPAEIHYLKWDPEEEVEEEDICDIHDISRIANLIRWFMKGATHV